MVREKVRQHAFGNAARPGEQNVARIGEPSRGKTKSTQSNERVATPIGEPRIAGHDGFAMATIDDVSISSAMERRGEFGPAEMFVGADSFCEFRGGQIAFARERGRVRCREHQHGFSGREVEIENAGCAEIFGVVESARGFLRVAEVLIPVWLVLVEAVRKRNHGGHAGMRIPRNALAVHGSLEAERGVFPVQTVIVAAGKKWANKEPYTFALAKQAPADLRELRFARDE